MKVAIHDDVPIVDGVPVPLEGLSAYSIVGQGANATVFAAHESVPDRRVAVKIYARAIEGDCRDKIRQARAEVEKLGTLKTHPGLIVPFNYREVAGHGVLVMEFVDGPTLRDWCSSGRSLEERHRVLSMTFRALLAAHKVGCLHGDLHWKNVLIGERGTPKIVDFGTSLFAGTRAGAAASREVASVVELTERVLPEPRELNLVDRASLAGSPSLTLATCDAWSELTLLLQILEEYRMGDPTGKPTPRFVGELARVATRGPGFDLRRLVAVLQQRGFTAIMANALLDYVSVAGGHVHRENKGYWHGCPPLDDRLADLESSWQEFRERQKQLPYLNLPIITPFPYADEWGQGDPGSE